jgi:DNA invertase Pin-like site-specific DNA recombinase
MAYAQLREFARVQGWTATTEYVDRVTGKHSDREQLQRLFQDASQRRFDSVFRFANPNRLGRALGVAPPRGITATLHRAT